MRINVEIQEGIVGVLRDGEEDVVSCWNIVMMKYDDSGIFLEADVVHTTLVKNNAPRVQFITMNAIKSHNKLLMKTADELFEIAFDKLKNDKSGFTVADSVRIIEIASQVCPRNSNTVAHMQKDISIEYKKFDALAMWCSGLLDYEPEFVRRVLSEIGGIE